MNTPPSPEQLENPALKSMRLFGKISHITHEDEACLPISVVEVLLNMAIDHERIHGK